MSSKDEFYIFDCPNCQENVIVHKNETNCKIFRHGVFKDSGQQIHPHLPRHICERLKSIDKIYGCGKPFRIELDVSSNIHAYICDYI